MITQLITDDSPIVALKVTGRVTMDDIATFERLFAEKKSEHKTVNVLIDLSEWQVRGSSLRAGLRERIWGVQNVSSMGRVAIVGWSAWLRAIVGLEAVVLGRLNPSASERYFDIKNLGGAWDFVRG